MGLVGETFVSPTSMTRRLLVRLVIGLAGKGGLRRLTTLRITWPMLLLLAVALAVKELGVLGPLANSSVTPWLFVLSNVALVFWAST